MGSFLNSAIYIGPFALALGLLIALFCCLMYLAASQPKKVVSLLRYGLIVLVVGVLAFVVGTALGIAAFCSFESSGNLCGLGGVFGVGPLLAGICMGGYGLTWLKSTRVAA